MEDELLDFNPGKSIKLFYKQRDSPIRVPNIYFHNRPIRPSPQQDHRDHTRR